MRPSLEEFLQQSGCVSEDQFRDARRTQKFFGGSLLSNLLRLNVLSPPRAEELFSEWSGYPPTTLRDVTDIPARVLGLVRPSLAARRQVLPFRWDDDEICVATARLDNDVFFRELGRRLETQVVPHAILEDRLMGLLEAYYGIQCASRESVKPAAGPATVGGEALPAAAAPAAYGSVGAETLPPGSRVSLEIPDRPQIGLDGLPMDAPVPAAEVILAGGHAVAAPAGHPALAEVHSDAGGTVTEPANETPSLFGTRTRPHLERLATAVDRDEVGVAAVGLCLASGLKRVVLFALQRERLIFWNAGGEGVEQHRLQGLTVPLYAPSIFAAMRLSPTPYLGIVPEQPANDELLAALGGPRPERVATVPIVVKGRCIAALYTDEDAGSVLPIDLSSLGQIATRVGVALEILLLRRKILS